MWRGCLPKAHRSCVPIPIRAMRGAIRAYEKAGFVRYEPRSTEWGDCLLMLARKEK